MKLDILFHYDVDENTGEMRFIGKEEISVDTVNKSNKNDIDDGVSKVILEPNKLTISKSALALLNAKAGDRIDVKYQKKGNDTIPVIGTEKSFGTNTGNKLTKSNTISFKGAMNDSLSEYGNEFTLESTNNDGIFYLIGNKNNKEERPDEIIDIDKELESLDLDDLNIEQDECELDKFNFIL